jgi:hypothetical protein
MTDSDSRHDHDSWGIGGVLRRSSPQYVYQSVGQYTRLQYALHFAAGLLWRLSLIHRSRSLQAKRGNLII